MTESTTCIRDGCNRKVELSPKMKERIDNGTARGFPCDLCRRAMVNVEVAKKLRKK